MADSAEFKTQAKDALNAPADFDKLWKLMDDSNAGTMQLKLYKKVGDKKPFRAIILVNGIREVKEILEFLDARDKE